MTLTEPARHAAYKDAEQRRTQLIGIAESIAELGRELGLTALADTTTNIARQVRSDAFLIIVVGDFNTGKSTLINALLGADALPRLPVECTAVLTEVRYADEPQVVLHHRGGTDSTPEPERVAIERLRELIVVDVDDPDAQSPYEYAEVHWPIELCRQNVVLVDSPGLNADPDREQLTLGYLSRADAVVVVMNANANMKRNEVDFMRSNLDCHDPYFVFNGINHIAPDEQELVKRSAVGRLRRVRPGHPADQDRIHWIDALSAIRTRIAGDTTGWEATGVGALERALEAFLTTDRHKVKIMVPARALRALRKDVAESIATQQRLLADNLEELTLGYERAQVPLERLQHDVARISTDLDNRLGDLADHMHHHLRARMVELAGLVPEWALESVPNSKLSIKPWKTEEQAEAVAQEIAEATARRVEVAFSEWVQADLAPDLSRRVNAIAAALDQQVVEFEHDLDAIRLDMSGMASTAAAATDDEESKLARIVAGVGGHLLAGPAVGLAGLRFGPREMAKALLPTIGILTIWLATPLGLPVLVTALIAQAIFGSNRTLRGVEKKIKQKVGEAMAKELRANSYQKSQEVATAFGSSLAEMRTELTESLELDLNTFRQEVEHVLAAKRRGEQAVMEERLLFTSVSERLDEVMSRLDDLVDEIASL